MTPASGLTPASVAVLRGLGEIEQAVALLARTLTTHALVTDEGRAVLEVVQKYTRTWKLARGDGSPRLADNAVVALALLVAESDPPQKDLMIRLILSLLGDETT